jgi:hypothetical protein
VEVINETIQAEESARVMKAIPLTAAPKSVAKASRSKPRRPKPTATPTATPSPTATPAKRGFLFQPFKKK